MNSSKLLRTSIVLAAVAVGACAHAQISLISVSDGNLVLNSPSPGLDTATETVDFMAGGYTSLTADTWTVTDLPVGSDYVGTGTYTGPGGNLSISFVLPTTNKTSVGSSLGYDGTWTYVSGTGSYAGKTGGGTLAIDLIPINGQFFTGTSLSGTLNAVPEPAPSAVIGAGVLGLCLVRRRKR